jgi:hypothetical protein
MNLKRGRSSGIAASENAAWFGSRINLPPFVVGALVALIVFLAIFFFSLFWPNLPGRQ